MMQIFRITDRLSPKGLNGLNGDKFQEVVGGEGEEEETGGTQKASQSARQVV